MDKIIYLKSSVDYGTTNSLRLVTIIDGKGLYVAKSFFEVGNAFPIYTSTTSNGVQFIDFLGGPFLTKGTIIGDKYKVLQICDNNCVLLEDLKKETPNEIVRYYYTDDISVCKGEILVDSEGRVLDVVSKSPAKKLPRMTICGIIDTETRTIKFGVSRCSVGDVFVRKVGRELAFKKAQTHPESIKITIEPSESFNDAFLRGCHLIEKQYRIG